MDITRIILEKSYLWSSFTDSDAQTPQYVFSNSHKISLTHIKLRSKNLQNATYRNIKGYEKIRDNHWILQLPLMVS